MGGVDRPRKRQPGRMRVEERPAPKKEDGFLRKVTRRPARWIAMGVGAVLVAVLVAFRDPLVGEVVRKETVVDEFREMRGEDAIQVVRVERQPMDDEMHTYVIPGGAPLATQDAAAIADASRPDFLPTVERLETGAVPLGFATWRILLRGKRSQGVRVMDVKVVDVKKEEPFDGTLVSMPPQGGDKNQMMGVNGDEVAPVVRDLESTGGSPWSWKLGRPYFEGRTLSLGDRQEEVLSFRAYSRKHDLSFALEIEFQTGDARGSLRVDLNGSLFRVTAPRCVGDVPAYPHTYGLSSSVTYGLHHGTLPDVCPA